MIGKHKLRLLELCLVFSVLTIRRGIKRIEYDILYLDDNHSANLSKLVDEVTELQGMFENAENETFERVFALIDSLNQRMGVIMPPEVADLQRARTAFSNSQALTRRAEMLDQPSKYKYGKYGQLPNVLTSACVSTVQFRCKTCETW